MFFLSFEKSFATPDKDILEKEREEFLICRKIELVSLRNNIIDNQESDRLRYVFLHTIYNTILM